jgi:hypothetical protein
MLDTLNTLRAIVSLAASSKSCTILINGRQVCIHDREWKECQVCSWYPRNINKAVTHSLRRLVTLQVTSSVKSTTNTSASIAVATAFSYVIHARWSMRSWKFKESSMTTERCISQPSSTWYTMTTRFKPMSGTKEQRCQLRHARYERK